MKIYICGRMSGLPDHGYAAFESAAKRIRAKWPEATVFSPPEMNQEDFRGRTDLPHEVYMLHDLPRVLDCDLMALLPNWQDSKGAQLEVAVGAMTGKGFMDAESLKGIPAPEPRFTSLAKPSVLLEAHRIVSGERQNTYGSPKRNFARIAAMWAPIFEDGQVTPLKVGLAMIALKTARLLNGYHHDSLVDVAGYAAAVQAAEMEGKE